MSHVLVQWKLSLALVVICAAATDGLVFQSAGFRRPGDSPRRSWVPRPSSSTKLQAVTSRDAIAQLHTAQLETVQNIASTFPTLQSRVEFSWNPTERVLIGDHPASLDGWEGPGPDANVAWLSSLLVESKLSSLTILCGPLTNVPHLLSRCAVIDNNDQQALNLVLDFIPRAYGAYEMRDKQGNYPGPETLGRDAFTYSGNRMEYESKFGTTDLVRFMEDTYASLEGAQVRNSPSTSVSNLDRLVRGPLYMDVVCALTERNVAAIQVARQRAAEYYWLSWARQPDQYAHQPGAPINAQYVYDTKYKQNAFGSLLARYTELFGPEDGSRLAAADSGPLDEAYVGGAS